MERTEANDEAYTVQSIGGRPRRVLVENTPERKEIRRLRRENCDVRLKLRETEKALAASQCELAEARGALSVFRHGMREREAK